MKITYRKQTESRLDLELSLFGYQHCTKKRKAIPIRTPEKDNQRGTALCLRPQSLITVARQKVIHANESLQGLTLYGDDKNLITWGVKRKTVAVEIYKEEIPESILMNPVLLIKTSI